MIKDLLQSSLDEVLFIKDILVYDQRKSGGDADKYVVYSVSADIKEEFADDETLIKNANVTVKFYYRSEILDSHDSRQLIRGIENLIEVTLEESGFIIPFGKFDGGDVDDIGYNTTIFECEYWRVV